MNIDISDIIKLLNPSDLPVWVIPATIIFHLFYALERHVDVAGDDGFLLLLPLLIVALVLAYKVTRAIAGVKREQKGSASLWFGWSAVSFLPVFFGMILLFLLMPETLELTVHPLWPLETLILCLGLGVGIPFSVHATGHALDRNRTNFSISSSLSTFGGSYIVVATQVFLITLVPAFLVGGFSANWWLESLPDSVSYFFSFCSGIFGAASFLIIAAITVHLWQQVDQNLAAEKA